MWWYPFDAIHSILNGLTFFSLFRSRHWTTTVSGVRCTKYVCSTILLDARVCKINRCDYARQLIFVSIYSFDIASGLFISSACAYQSHLLCRRSFFSWNLDLEFNSSNGHNMHWHQHTTTTTAITKQLLLFHEQFQLTAPLIKFFTIFHSVWLAHVHLRVSRYCRTDSRMHYAGCRRYSALLISLMV